MKFTITLITAAMLAAPGFAEETADAETVEKIEAMLASIECQMDLDDIEVTPEGYELDDVFCKGGDQFDIELDKDLNETGRKAE